MVEGFRCRVCGAEVDVVDGPPVALPERHGD